MGACYYKLLEVYRERRCKSIFIGGNEQYLAFTAIENLKRLSSQVPARAQLVNVRMHYNGWHTDKRYQRKGSVCRLCALDDTEDSIEHTIQCKWVCSFFPDHLKSGSPPKLAESILFLFGLSDECKIAASIFNYALYTVGNELRHSGDTRDIKLMLKRIMGEIYMKPSVLQAWESMFGFQHSNAPKT